ncbi:hypothetical protein F889_00752 [Acinetobacter colistiniresistens]|uniref:MbtH-like domain-containing protein n=1 Tax=Acinetobacter colistiniresistens TaxID=280145 RepID=N9R955_9GAMM|nr:MbtH family protein [Acinetobacter colistiniresistens]ENX35677.1 hypothetical protein F889_00752 [Acinetobacter colistiniresistens]
MSTLQENYINPFDNEKLSFFVLKNVQGEFSLWPEFHALPAGWEVQLGPDTRSECIRYVEQHWKSINPFHVA